MKNLLKPGLILVGVVAILSLVFVGIRTFQGQDKNIKPSSKEEKRFLNATKDISNLPVSPDAPKFSTETKKVDVVFKTETQEFTYEKVALYNITVKDGKTVAATTDGNLAIGLIDNIVIKDDVNKPIPAEVTKLSKGSLMKIVRGKKGQVIDKEQTLQSLNEEIKLANNAATLTVEVVMKEDYGSADFDAKRLELGFSTLLTEFDTLHEGHIDDKGRNVNLSLAAKKIDGLIIPSGKKFGFNKIVGPRTRKYGYQNAGVISRGRVIAGLGGGICQVSTTLYTAIIEANLKIIERHNHSIYDGIEYSEKGMDSAIAWGYKDLRFKNPLKTPILISCISGSGSVHVKVYCKEKPDTKISLETRNIIKHPFKVKSKVNRKLKKGTKKVVRPGVTGYSVETYRIVTTNGKSKEERLSKDRYLTYNAVEEINN